MIYALLLTLICGILCILLKDKELMLMSFAAFILLSLVACLSYYLINDMKVEEQKQIDTYLEENYILGNEETSYSYSLMKEKSKNLMTLKKESSNIGLVINISLKDIENNQDVYDHFEKFNNYDMLNKYKVMNKYVEFEEYPGKIYPISQVYKTKKDGIFELINEGNYYKEKFELVKVK